MNKSEEQIEAVRKVVEMLEPFNSRIRERILRWASESLLDAGSSHSQDMMATLLFYVFRTLITEQGQDKKYWFSKIRELNKISEAMSDYLKELYKALLHLKDSEAEMATIEIRHFKMESSISGEYFQSGIKKMNADELKQTISEVESLQETLRNQRQQASKEFENFDQKANQLYNLLSSVMKAMNEMRMGTVRNML